MPQAGCITGASTMLVVSWLEEHKGQATVDALFHRLRHERGHPVERHDISKDSQVDFHLHTTILEEVAALTAADDETLREIGRDGARNVHTVVKGATFMLKMASPTRLLKHAPRLWGTYADFGSIDVLERTDGKARLRIHGFQTHPHFCRTLEGFFEELLTMVGASEVQIREVEHSGSGCVFEGTWS